LLVMAVGFIVTATNSITRVSGQGETPSPTPTPRLNLYTDAKPMPPELAYWALFQEIQALKDKDGESLAQSERTNFKNSFYTNRLGLESSQFAAVDTAATECLANIQPIDQSAREIIKKYRAQFPNGELKKIQPSSPPNKQQPARPQKSFESLPPVPAELKQLQNQKNQIILNAKEKIKQSLGQAEFAAFDSSVQKNAARVLIPLNLANKVLPPLATPTPTPGN
ncbi:MAG TPA: hypothetical protein VGB68_07295, partial [Pyrinomonadaceae bacterium]